MTKRFLIADDHSIIRNALKYAVMEISEECEFVEAANFSGLNAELHDHKDDLSMVIMDLHMPGYNNLEQISEVVSEADTVPVVVFSMLENANDIRQVLESGIKAYIPKSTDNAQIAHILHLVLSGGTYIPPMLSNLAAGNDAPTLSELTNGNGSGQSQERLEDLPIWSDLTRRQREVLVLMGDGLSNSDISERLDLTLSTVKTHVTGIFRALDVDNRTQAVLKLKGFKLPSDVG